MADSVQIDQIKMLKQRVARLSMTCEDQRFCMTSLQTIESDVFDIKEKIEGEELNVLVHGEKTHLIESKFKKGSVHKLHSHPHEQTGYVVSGRLMMTIGDEKFEAEAGASWSIPGGVEYSGEILEETVVVEVFSPVREEYLP